jgi:tetraacyldisaccharide 4'-kinase
MNEMQWKALITGKQQGWQANVLRAGLRAVSLPYGVGVRSRNWAFDRGLLSSTKAARPVISVGNLTVGGTGKTPVVEWLARWFRQHDRRVAILSRGYGAADGPNDEALVLEENLPDVPHLQGADRTRLAQIAVDELEAELLILDDGFQHRRLHRDLDIVLVDAMNPWGNGRLFPAGPLREPLTALGRADLILMTRAETQPPAQQAGLTRLLARYSPAPIFPVSFPATTLHQTGRPPISVAALAGQKVAAFCGIGHPEAFSQTLIPLGAQVVAQRAFPDHHAYSAEDVESLRHWSENARPDGLVTTQKDSVKLRLAEIGGLPLWAVRIEAVLHDPTGACDDLLRQVLATLL